LNVKYHSLFLRHPPKISKYVIEIYNYSRLPNSALLCSIMYSDVSEYPLLDCLPLTVEVDDLPTSISRRPLVWKSIVNLLKSSGHADLNTFATTQGLPHEKPGNSVGSSTPFLKLDNLLTKEAAADQCPIMLPNSAMITYPYRSYFCF